MVKIILCLCKCLGYKYNQKLYIITKKHTVHFTFHIVYKKSIAINS